MTYTENECYVDVWREPDFQGESRRFYGPSSHSHLHFRESGWANDIASLRVGPHAFVLAYRGENFTGQYLMLGPNDEVRDLRPAGFAEDIDSLKLVHSLKIFDRLYEDAEGEPDPPATPRPRKGTRARR